MKKKKWFLLTGALAACGGFAQSNAENLPNIVLILADDMGYGDVSSLNEDAKLTTPNIDRMARLGVSFTDAHTCSSVSTPSRYGLLTGRYNWRSDLKEGVLYGYNGPMIRSGRRTMADMLRQCGYTTACIGKWHLGWQWGCFENLADSIYAASKEGILEMKPSEVDFSRPILEGPTTRGFDYFYGIAGSLDMPPYVYIENDRVTALPDRTTGRKEKFAWWRTGPTGSDFVHEEVLPNFVNRAADYIREHAQGEQPFFLYLPLPAPHTPILPSKEFQGKSGLNAYGDFVLMVDAMVGQIQAALEESGAGDHTVLIFTTDNGCSPEADFEELTALGHDPSYIFRGHKADLFDGGHRVPCLLTWPGKISPKVVSQTICLTDFYATFAALAGYVLDDSEAEDSYDLSPVLFPSLEAFDDEEPTIREATIHHSIYGQFTIRKGKWKLLLSPSSGGWSFPAPGKDDEIIAALPPVQLYDMEADPEESSNLYAEHPDVVEELTQLLVRYVKSGRSTPGEPQANDGPEVWEQVAWMEVSE